MTTTTSTIRFVIFRYLWGAALLLAPWNGAGSAAQDAAKPACTECHDIGTEFHTSVHGQAGLECGSCHADLAEAAEFPHAAPKAVDCVSCHDVPVSRQHPPGCAECHGSHEIRRAKDLTSPELGDLLAGMCGSCHEQIVRDYREGIHGRALAEGIPDVPTCLTCHGGHAILLTKDPNSPVRADAQASTCASCHDNEEIARKYGLPPARLQTFRDSFHGLANAYGDRQVANCASCHGVHRILPSSDPNSTIAAKNLPTTCGKCHPQAGRNFAVGKVHLLDRWEDNPFTYVARRFYQGAIGGMMGVFVIFMAVDFTFRRRRNLRRRPRS